MLATLLHRGNLGACQEADGPLQPLKALAPAPNLRFNLKKMPYMLVAAFKTDNRG